ncbi:MAG TPA: hypothetical protein GXX72_01100 [Clostridiaceae bacterium]|nr:hypothetical protein [Clostridiaceae bacterium]
MVETQTIKCPNCAGPMVFDPGASQIHCEYCDSIFDQDELIRQYQAEQTATKSEVAKKQEKPEEPLYGYNCSNCGANVWTDDTTLATYCFYCHNPVVVTPKIAGGFAPDGVVPFTVPKEEVINAFLKWSKAKKFTPRDFGTQDHLEKMNGVYLPFWRADGVANYRIQGEGVNSSESRTGKFITTTSEVYEIYREGMFEANSITALANDKAAEQLVIGAKPFATGEVKPFHPAFLQGFFAELNNITKEQAGSDFSNLIHQNAANVVERSVNMEFDTTSPFVEFTPLEIRNWQLVMHPFWLLTYRKNDVTYLFCMNGASGQTFGELPISGAKLFYVALIIGVVLLILLLLLGYFL